MIIDDDDDDDDDVVDDTSFMFKRLLVKDYQGTV